MGEEIGIRVEDQHASPTDHGDGSAFTVNATCTGALGEKQQILLTETDFSTGVFTASVQPGNPGQLSAISGTPIYCEYPLLQPPTLLEASAVATASVEGAMTAEPTSINIGGVITISVTDFDLNTDASTAETHQGLLTIQSTSDVKYLDLTEISDSSSIFTAKIIASETAANSPLQTILTRITVIHPLNPKP